MATTSPLAAGQDVAVILRFGEFELDLGALQLRRAGEVVHIEPQVYDVLSYLVTNRDRLVPKEELLDEVWGSRFVTESALTSRIKAVRAAVGDDGVALSVRDEGPGFDQERAVEVFKPFHRIEPTVDDSAGVGLGLTITRRLVRRLGGDIWARSAPGEGATFTVLLPPVPSAD